MATEQMIRLLANEITAYLSTVTEYKELNTNLQSIFAQPQEDIDAAVQLLVSGGIVSNTMVEGGPSGQTSVMLVNPNQFVSDTGDTTLDAVLNALYAKAIAAGAMASSVEATINAFLTALAGGPSATFTPSTGNSVIDGAFSSLLQTVRQMISSAGTGAADQLGPFLVAVGALGYNKPVTAGHARFVANVAVLHAAVTRLDTARAPLMSIARSTQLLADKMPAPSA